MPKKLRRLEADAVAAEGQEVRREFQVQEAGNQPDSIRLGGKHMRTRGGHMISEREGGKSTRILLMGRETGRMTSKREGGREQQQQPTRWPSADLKPLV